MTAIRQVLLVSILAFSVECYWPRPHNNFGRPLRKPSHLRNISPLFQLNNPYDDIKTLLEDEISNYNIMIRRTTLKKTRGFYNDEFFPGFGLEQWLNHVFNEAIGSDGDDPAGYVDNKLAGDGDNHAGDDNDDISKPRPSDDIVLNVIDDKNNELSADEDLEIDPRKDEEEIKKQ